VHRFTLHRVRETLFPSSCGATNARFFFLPRLRGGGRAISFSRCVLAPELWKASSRERETEREVRQVVAPAVVLRSSPLRKACSPDEAKRNPGSPVSLRSCSRTSLHSVRATKRKISEAKRRQTQGSSAVPYGHGRASSVRRTTVGVPPRFSPQGVFHLKGLSLRPGFLGRGGTRFA
jgi:hypothetical protein